MSFEGYYQKLCKNGHLFGGDVYSEEPNKCPFCNFPPVWEEMVDTTNDDGNPTKLKVKEIKKCICCATVLETIFHIPKVK